MSISTFFHIKVISKFTLRAFHLHVQNPHTELSKTQFNAFDVISNPKVKQQQQNIKSIHY